MNTASQSPVTAERRKSSRARALKNALIVFNKGHSAIKCQIVEVSDTGAKLIPDDPFLCPAEFMLKPDFGEPHPCEVRWRRGAKVGVRYLPERRIANDATGSDASNGSDAVRNPDVVQNPETLQSLASLQDVIERSILVNNDNPKSAAFLAVSVTNIQSLTNFLGDKITEPLLNEIAIKLRERIRSADIIGRISNNQLGICLPYFRMGGAEVVAERVRQLASRPIKIPHGLLDVQLSVGYVVFPDRYMSSSEVITRAQATLAYNVTKKDVPLQLTPSMAAGPR